MNSLKEKSKSERLFSIVLTVLLLAFLGMIFYVNLSCNPDYYDGDIYNDINYAKEAWKAKSIFPKDWIFGNQTYVVATPVLAALFYGVTGNGFTAMATASCIMTVLVVLTYDWMTRTLFSYNERTAGFLCLMGALLIKAHVATSQQGLQAFFTMASYYSCYLINAFVVYGCYVRLRQKNFGKKHIVMAVIGVALSFGTGMQSLRQTAVMALPLVGCEVLMIIIYSIKEKKFAITSSTAFAAVVFVSNIAGLIAMKFIEINQNSIYGTTEFVKSFKVFRDKVFFNVEYVCLTFGPDSLEVRPRIAVSMIFLLIIFAAFVLCTVDFFKGKCVEQRYFTLMVVLALGCVSVFATGVFLDIVSRALYFFMIYPLFSVCISYIILRFPKKRNLLFSAVVILVAVTLSYRTVESVREIKVGKDENSTAHQIADYMLDNGYDTIYSTFGLSTLVDGAEDVVVASGDRIHLVQHKRADKSDAMKPVDFLCVKDDFKNRDNKKSLYIVRDLELPYVEKITKKYGVKMTKVAEFDEGKALYAMSENLCAIIAAQG